MVFRAITQFTFPHTFSVQFLTGIIPRQTAYHEMSVRSLVFGKVNHSLSFKLSLFYNTNCNIISSSLSKNSLSITWPLIEMIGQPYTIPFHPYHQNNPPTVQSPYLLYPSGTIQTLFCQSNIYNICRIIFSGGTVLSVDSTTVQPQYPQNPPKTAFNQQSVLSKNHSF